MVKKEKKFEEAMSALEQIVRQLESGNVPRAVFHEYG